MRRDLSGGLHTFRIVDFGEWIGDEPVLEFPDHPTAVRFLLGLRQDPSNVAALREMHAGETGGPDPSPIDDDEIVERLAWDLVSGRLRVLTRPAIEIPSFRMVFGESTSEATEEPPAEDTEETEHTWIEIRLVDEDDQPVERERYRITHPDGTVSEGVTDAQGSARVDGIDPGNCNVTFPDLDKAAWERAS